MNMQEACQVLEQLNFEIQIKKGRKEGVIAWYNMPCVSGNSPNYEGKCLPVFIMYENMAYGLFLAIRKFS